MPIHEERYQRAPRTQIVAISAASSIDASLQPGTSRTLLERAWRLAELMGR
jgi:hypothetical protein